MRIEDFVQDIIAQPSEDSLRLIFADFLEEQGDARAEMIRLQFELRTLDKTSSEFRKKRKRELSLLKQYQGFGRVPPGVKVVSWLGGFVDEIEVTVARFLKLAPEIFQQSPVRGVTLTSESRRFAQLQEIDSLRQLRKLRLKNNHASEPEVLGLLREGAFEELQELMVRDVELSNASLKAVGESEHFAKLESIEISGGPINSPGVAHLLSSPHLGRLRDIELGNSLDDSALHQIAEAPIASQLERLEVWGRFTESGLVAIFSKGLVALESLAVHLRGNRTTDLRGLKEVEIQLPSLKHLSLDHGLPNGALETLMNSDMPDLISLDLSNNQIGDYGIQMFASSPLLGKLKRLVLTNNQISRRGVDHLVQSPHWNGSQTKLYLRGNNFNQAECESLKKDFGKSFGNLGSFYW